MAEASDSKLTQMVPPADSPLTALSEEEAAHAELPPLITVSKEDIKIRIDTARRRIAYVLVGTLVGVIAFPIIALLTGWMAANDIKEILPLLTGPVVGLVGTVVGFYFGEKAAYRE